MKKLTLALFLACSATFALENTAVTTEVKSSSLKEVLSRFNFNYFIKYTGRSLSNNYKSGTTFNRFDGGVDAFNDKNDLDSTGSTQLYHSFKLGYNIYKNWTLSYGVTFQENLTDDVKFSWPNGAQGTRSNGRSYNGHRTSLFIPSVANFSFGWLGGSIFYQTPVAEERAGGTRYGYGLQPTLGIYSKVSGLSHGINFSYERIVNKDETGTAQGVKTSISPYLNYRINDRFTLKNSFDFDWDQKGKDIGTSKFGRNMHDVGQIGLGTKLRDKMYLDLFLVYSIYQLDAKNTSLGASLDISI